MPEEVVAKQIAALERQLQRQRRLLVSMWVVVAGIALTAFVPKPPHVLRARGLVIVDAAGRERILIGAPIPDARHRVRTDSARAARAWASRFPDPAQYMRWYAGYRHSMHGMLVLDENGIDRLAVGDSTPDPNIGKRIGAGPGLIVNDAQGFERTGYGMLTVAGRDRVVLGLDGNDGQEAVVLSVQDGGHAGLSVRGAGGRSIFLGARDSVVGLALRKGQRDAHRLTTDDVPPRD